MSQYLIHALDGKGRYFCEVTWATSEAASMRRAQACFVGCRILSAELR
jgi:hypothetical protein